jgi:hypothetical protein
MGETARVDTELRRRLRAALHQADGAAIKTAVASLELSRYLQIAGDALLIAVAQRSAGAVESAAECLEQLRARDWDGDQELAAELAAALGCGPAPLLRPLPVIWRS